MPVTITGSNTPTAGGVVYGDGTTYVTTSAGTSGQFLQSSGSGAPVWAAAGANIVRSARTSNTILGTADKGNLIAITSGTFTQTFTAAATLGNGWFVYLQNSGTGDITLDPNGSETIDGLTSYIMYPNEVRLVQCDGTAFYTIVLNAFTRTFTTTGTFTKPPGYTYIDGYMWGAGGGGGKSSQNSTGYRVGGGGGGACVPFHLATGSISASTTITIGAGGTGSPGTGSAGSVGGNSTFGSLITAYGGGGGRGNSGADRGGGGGGGILSAGSSAGDGSSDGGQAGSPQNFNGSSSFSVNVGFGGGTGGGYSNSGGVAVWGGGGGGYGNNAEGSTVWGGGGGGGVVASSSAATGGTSIYGGGGGSGSLTGTASNGTAPGGGGGATATGTAGDGGRGECRLWGVI